jgi:SPP1 gp7 family putative phage head morphogenesis protein
MQTFLQSQAPKIAAQCSAAMHARGFGKADLSAHELDALDAIVAGVDFAGWSVLVGEISDIIADIVRDGTVSAFTQIGIAVEARPEVVNVVNDYALAYARQRAAEMVGMRVDALGHLIPNPRAAWQITEGTREYLRADVAKAIAEGWSNDRLAAALADAYAFSKERATVIARTETNRAANMGALEGYKVSNVVGSKEWLTAEDDKVTPDCAMNGDAGPIPLTAAFPSGAQAPPDHPNCRCAISPVVDWTMVDNIPTN